MAKQKFRAVVDLFDVENKLIAAAGKPIEKPAEWLVDQGLVELVAPDAPAEEE